MFKRRSISAFIAVLLALSMGVLANAPAHADPLPAQYSGSTSGDVLSLGLSALGIANINADVGHSATEVDSTENPRAHAESSNVGVNALGLPVSPISGEANSGPGAPTDSYTMGLGDITVPGVLNIGALQGSGSTNWPGDLSCVPDGTPIAESTTELANASLGLSVAGVGLNILELGAVSTSGNTTLNAGSVVSTATGNVASLSLLNNLVQVQVLDQPTITATSDGTTGTVTADDYSVAVTIAGQTTVLSPGMSIPINLNLGVAQANLTLSVGQLQDNSVGANASGSMDFLNLSGSLSAPLLGQIANVDLGLLPLSATANAPEGGVECDRVDAPTITTPLDGSTVTDNPPTITGAGVPGAEVTVYDNGQPIGTTTVGPDGEWTFTPPGPLSPGDHEITATQSGPDGATSEPSNSVTVTVPGPPAPEPPTITAPPTGSTVTDSTPPISGTGEPGSAVTIYDNGEPIGTAPVGPDGSWTFTPTAPLAPGDHEITATQTSPEGATSTPSEPITITVVAPPVPEPPVITAPPAGSTVDDTTPPISGTGEPGATVTVNDNGQPIGTTTVGPDGEWSFTPTGPLACGEHVITATQTNASGAVSAVSAAVTITIACPPGGDGDGSGDGTGGGSGGGTGGGSGSGGAGGGSGDGSAGGTGSGSGAQQTAGSGHGSTTSLAQTGSPVDAGLLGLLGVLLLIGGATAVHRTRNAKS